MREAGAIVAVVRDGETKCTGVVTGLSRVLTAAHCFRAAEGLSIRFGDQEGSAGGTRRVMRVVKHGNLDAGLLELEAPLPAWIIPLALPTEGLTSPEMGRMVAVGRRGEDSRDGPSLLRAMVIHSGTELEVDYEGEAGLCRGDSGGPLVTRELDGRVVVWGILRDGAMGCRGPDRFTRTSFLGAWVGRK